MSTSRHWAVDLPVAEIVGLASFLAFVTLLLLAGDLFASGQTASSVVTTGVEITRSQLIVAVLAIASLCFAVIALLIYAVTR